MPEHPHPHDRFFTQVFSTFELAEDILINHIPQIAELIVPGSIENCSEEFTNPELGKYAADLLLKAQRKNGGDMFFYLLLEHKSYHEPQVAFHLLRYIVRIWEKVKETDQSKPLPFIFPVVLYHGKRKWNTGTNITSLVDIPPDMEAYSPSFNYCLFDLSQYRDEEIKGEILSRVSLLLFKHIFDDDFGIRFIHICALLRELKDKKTALEYLRSVLEYIGNTSDKIVQEQVREGVETALSHEGTEIMPTLFEQLKDEGRQEGIQIGREETLKSGIQLALELKFGEDGLAFYQQIQESATIKSLQQIEQVIRNIGSIHELEQLYHKNFSENQ